LKGGKGRSGKREARNTAQQESQSLVKENDNIHKNEKQDIRVSKEYEIKQVKCTRKLHAK
jgi:hypothetical protein